MRRVAWTRLLAIGLATGLVVHAIARASAQIWLGEATAALEGVAALLLLRARTRATGVLFGVVALSVAGGAALLSTRFAGVIAPIVLTVGLLVLGRRLDRDNKGWAAARGWR